MIQFRQNGILCGVTPLDLRYQFGPGDRAVVSIDVTGLDATETIKAAQLYIDDGSGDPDTTPLLDARGALGGTLDTDGAVVDAKSGSTQRLRFVVPATTSAALLTAHTLALRIATQHGTATVETYTIGAGIAVVSETHTRHDLSADVPAPSGAILDHAVLTVPASPTVGTPATLTSLGEDASNGVIASGLTRVYSSLNTARATVNASTGVATYLTAGVVTFHVDITQGGITVSDEETVTIAAASGSGGGGGGSTDAFAPSMVVNFGANDNGPQVGPFYPYESTRKAWIASPDVHEFRTVVSKLDGANPPADQGGAITAPGALEPQWNRWNGQTRGPYTPTAFSAGTDLAGSEPNGSITDPDPMAADRFTPLNIYTAVGDAGKKLALSVVAYDFSGPIYSFGEIVCTGGWQDLSTLTRYTDTHLDVPIGKKRFMVSNPANAADRPSTLAVQIGHLTPAADYLPIRSAGVHITEPPRLRDRGFIPEKSTRQCFLRSNRPAIDGDWTSDDFGHGRLDPMGQEYRGLTANSSGVTFKMDGSVPAGPDHVGQFMKLTTESGDYVRFACVAIPVSPGLGAVPADNAFTAKFTVSPDGVVELFDTVETAMVPDAAATKRRATNGARYFRVHHLRVNDVAKARGDSSTSYGGATGDAFTITDNDGTVYPISLTAGRTVAQTVADINAQLPSGRTVEAYVTSGGFVGLRATDYNAAAHRRFTLAQTSGAPLESLGIPIGVHTRDENYYARLVIKCYGTGRFDIGDIGCWPEQYSNKRDLWVTLMRPPHADDVAVEVAKTMTGYTEQVALNRTQGCAYYSYFFTEDQWAISQILTDEGLTYNAGIVQGGADGGAGGSMEAQLVRNPGDDAIKVIFHLEVDSTLVTGDVVTASGLPPDNTTAAFFITGPGQHVINDLWSVGTHWSTRIFDTVAVQNGRGTAWRTLANGDVYNGRGAEINMSGMASKTDPAYDHTAGFSGNPLTPAAVGSDRDDVLHISAEVAVVATSNLACSPASAQARVDSEIARIAA